jgi:MFS family permease
MVGFFASIGLLIPTLPLYVRDLGGSPIDVGLIVGIFSFGVLVVRRSLCLHRWLGDDGD